MIRYVQDAADARLGNATVTFTPTAGNLLVATTAGFLPGTSFGVMSDNRGGVWKSLGAINSQTNYWGAIWYCLSAASSLSTIFTLGVSVSNTTFLNVSEWSGTSLNLLSGNTAFSPIGTVARTPYINVPSGRSLMVASFLASNANTGPQGLFSPLTTATRSFDWLTAYSLNDQHVPQRCEWGIPSSDQNQAFIAAFAESPTFIDQRPIGGRGASW